MMKKGILFLALALTYSSVSLSMAHLMKKAVHWGIAAGPLWNEAQKRYATGQLYKRYVTSPPHEDTHFDDVSPQVRTFIHETITANSADPASFLIKINKFEESPWSSCDNGRQLWLSPCAAKELDSLLEENNQKLLDWHRFAITHELSHLERRSGYRSIGFDLAVPFVTHSVVSQWNAASKLGINFLLSKYNVRHEEYMADKHNSIHERNIVAAIDHWTDKSELNKNLRSKIEEAFAQSKEVSDKINILRSYGPIYIQTLIDWCSDHPLPSKRTTQLNKCLISTKKTTASRKAVV